MVFTPHRGRWVLSRSPPQSTTRRGKSVSSWSVRRFFPTLFSAPPSLSVPSCLTGQADSTSTVGPARNTIPSIQGQPSRPPMPWRPRFSPTHIYPSCAQAPAVPPGSAPCARRINAYWLCGQHHQQHQVTGSVSSSVLPVDRHSSRGPAHGVTPLPRLGKTNRFSVYSGMNKTEKAC